MKGRILILLMAVVFALPSFSQAKKKHNDRDSRRQEMLEMKMNFIADEMQLNDAQKKQFFEVYAQMENERRAVFKKIKKAEKTIADNKDASEADYDRASREIAAARAEMTTIEQQYDDKFATFLTKKQIYLMKTAENKFLDKMKSARDKKKRN